VRQERIDFFMGELVVSGFQTTPGKDGWACSYWCESAECEARVKEDTKATTRCIPLGQEDGHG